MSNKKNVESSASKSRILGDLSRRSFLRVASATAVFAGAGQIRSAFAATSTIPLTGPNQPLQPGSGFQISTSDQIAALLAWTPDSGTSKYFRSRVPLASRIPVFAATQAHPHLSSQPRLGTLTDYYIGTDFEGIRQRVNYGNTSVPVYVSSFGQYQDVIGGWNGAQTLPTASYIDAAHRNGTLILGILYQPAFPDFIAQNSDGSFPVGDKLVQMAEYFGYDGYFLNIEEFLPSDQAAALQKMMEAMYAKAKASGIKNFYIQWYDSMLPDGTLQYQGQINSQNGPWLTSKASTSIFIDYGWSGYYGEGCCGSYGDGVTNVASTTAYLEQNHLSPFKAAYYGLLTGNDLTTVGQYAPLIIPANGGGTPQGSLSSFVHGRRLLTNVNAATGANASTTTLRTALDQADRAFWSGVSGNPALPNDTVDPAAPLTPLYGLAAFIAERSVIGSFPFISRFNVGTGVQFFLEGKASSPLPWFNIAIQDILPTWQFWTKSKYSSAIVDGLLSAGFDDNIAYNGGTSVKVNGMLGPANSTELRLFKTRLAIQPNASKQERLELIFQMQEGESGSMQVGLIFEDDPKAVDWIQPYHTGQLANAWTMHKYALDCYAGRVIAAISLGFQVVKAKVAQPYSINIGELRMLDADCGVTRPNMPRKFNIDNSFPSTDKLSTELLLSWEFDASVWYYDIYREKSSSVAPDGERKYDLEWLGRIYDEVYYLGILTRLRKQGASTLQLVAVSHDGTTSKPAKTLYTWT